MSESPKDKKSLGQILHQDLSLDTLKDLMFWEIPGPFSKPERPDVNRIFQEVDSAEVEDPLRKFVAELEAEGQPVGRLLVDADIISEENLDRVLEEQERTGHSLPQTLLNLRLVPASEINDVIRKFRSYVEKRMSHSTLEDLLLQENLLDKDQLKKAVEGAHKENLSLEQYLIRHKMVSFDELGELFEKHFEIGVVDLDQTKVAKTAVQMLPGDLIKQERLIPFRKRNKELHVAMADPLNHGLLDRLRLMTGMDVRPFLASLDRIRELQAEHVVTAPAKVDPTQPVVKPEEPAASGTSPAAPTETEKQFEMVDSVENESTVDLVSRIIQGGFHARATDIHLEPQEDRLRVRYRIDGMLYDVMSISEEAAGPTASRIKVLAGMDITERRRPQDGQISMESGDEEFAMRVATLPTRHGEKIVLRLLNEGAVLRGLQQLGIDQEDLDRFKNYIERPHGMILTTGPIGSGKTTTLYSALNEVNRSTSNIITIEDPIEYELPGINQVQVDTKIGMDFANGLRAILRQDANVLMVGEIRDAETARTAVRAAMTGHLLFSTLHTNSAVGAIGTLRHMGIAPYLIASSLVCVVAQRLVRKVCPNCAGKEIPPLAVREELGLGAQSRRQLPKPVGCDKCYHTGYSGRTGVYEIFGVTERIREMIADGEAEPDIEKQAEAGGMTTLQEAARRKVVAGETTVEEYMRTLHT